MAFGSEDSYRHQLRLGVDHWRTVLDGAVGIDVFGSNGVSVGDIDGDGWDDLYVSQPSGLLNRPSIATKATGRSRMSRGEVRLARGRAVLDPTSMSLAARKILATSTMTETKTLS